MREVSRVLRDEPAPRPRAVAICALLVSGAASSPLFNGDPVALDAELRRIRYHATCQHAAAPPGDDADT